MLCLEKIHTKLEVINSRDIPVPLCKEEKKMGVAEVYIIFLTLAPNIDCGYH